MCSVSKMYCNFLKWGGFSTGNTEERAATSYPKEEDMKMKEVIQKLTILREALKQAKSPEEAQSILFEINRLESEDSHL